MSKTGPDMTGVMPSMLQNFLANWGGSPRNSLKAGCARPLAGISTIFRGLKVSGPALTGNGSHRIIRSELRYEGDHSCGRFGHASLSRDPCGIEAASTGV